MSYFLEPVVIHPGTSPIRITARVSLPVHWVMLAVRNMGGASYVAFGTRTAQESRLVGNGDYYVLDIPGGQVFEAGDLWCRSDASDNLPEVEVWAMGADA